MSKQSREVWYESLSYEPCRTAYSKREARLGEVFRDPESARAWHDLDSGYFFRFVMVVCNYVVPNFSSSFSSGVERSFATDPLRRSNARSRRGARPRPRDARARAPDSLWTRRRWRSEMHGARYGETPFCRRDRHGRPETTPFPRRPVSNPVRAPDKTPPSPSPSPNTAGVTG